MQAAERGGGGGGSLCEIAGMAAGHEQAGQGRAGGECVGTHLSRPPGAPHSAGSEPLRPMVAPNHFNAGRRCSAGVSAPSLAGRMKQQREGLVAAGAAVYRPPCRLQRLPIQKPSIASLSVSTAPCVSQVTKVQLQGSLPLLLLLPWPPLLFQPCRWISKVATAASHPDSAALSSSSADAAGSRRVLQQHSMGDSQWRVRPQSAVCLPLQDRRRQQTAGDSLCAC